MKQVSVFLIISITLVLLSCDTTEPPPPPVAEKPTIELALEDISCIEAWIKLKTTNLQLPASLELKQINPAGDSTIKILNLNTQDSLLYIDSLLPNQSYQYQAFSIEHPATSNELSVTTMDTTSHNFTFESWTFGTVGSSWLYDVAIINENNIWAVGGINVADTSQNGYTMYNAVHWDGIQWDLMQIPFLFQGDSFYNPIYAVFAFNADDIWFGIGNLIHWDGTRYFPIGISSVFQSLVNKIWGSSSENLYIVGNNGTIVHYNGVLWQRIESGTDLNIGDIWGIADGNGGYNKYLAADNAMLKIDNNNQLSRIDAEQGRSLGAVWGMTDWLIYTAGGYGLTLYKNYDWEIINVPVTNTIRVVRGQNHNDVYGLGNLGIILHFNGYTWQTIATGQNNTFYRIEAKNDFAVTVGWQGDKALITVIKRTQ